MFNQMATPYSLSDIAAVSNGNRNSNDGWGDGGYWWIIILFLIWGRNGWGNDNNGNGNGGGVTRNDLCESFNFNGLQRSVAGLQQGLCDGFYAMNNGMLTGFSNLGTTVMQGFNGVDKSICNLGYQTQQGFNDASRQLADCCCENRAAIAQVRYDMATNTCALQNTIQNTTRDIMDNDNANWRALNDRMTQMEMSRKDERIAELQSLVNSLNLAQSQANQNNYLVNTLRPCPTPAYITCNPWGGQAPYGTCYQPRTCCNNNGGCGCNGYN